MRRLLGGLALAAYVACVLLLLLFISDVLLRRTWRWVAFLMGYALLGGAYRARPRPGAAAVTGALALAACIAAAHAVWPLANETTGAAFFEGRGTVNYVFLPWLHGALFLAAIGASRLAPRSGDP